MTEQNVKFLEDAFPSWRKLTQGQQDSLKQSAVEQKYAKGVSLHHGSEDCSGLFVVKSGQLRVYTISESGKEITLYRLFDRDICLFSASCMLKNISFDVHVEAEKDTLALLIPTPVYEGLMKNSLVLTDFTNQLLASRFSDVMWVMEQVLFTSFDRRLAAFLLEQSSIESSDTLHITHEEISRHMGSAREVVTRMLKYFQAEGMVTLSRGGIAIVDESKLKKLI
ncbi:Crp/Fnr family transcriptional regulator [Oscillospiraceae bacterium PP1C4]